MSNLIMRMGIAVGLLGALVCLSFMARGLSASPPVPAVALFPPAGELEIRLAPNQREYVYYPDGGFYYAPRTRTWFWQEQGKGKGVWRHGLSLPEQFWDASGHGIPIVLESDLPYLEHEMVFAHYAELRQMLAYHSEAAELAVPID